MKNPFKRKGSALLVVVLITGAVAVMVGSTLRYGVHEAKINQDHFYRLEAETAAEALVYYGMAELHHRFESALAPSLSQMTVPTEYKTLYNGSNIDASSLDIYFADQTNYGMGVIDREDPANQNDPLKGKRVNLREIKVYAKAAAQNPQTGSQVWGYCSGTFHVRESSLFTHAIFYVMDLEFHPGPNMDIFGPVHSNRDIWVQAGSKSANRLRFHGMVSSTGNMYHGYKLDGSHRKGSVLFQNTNGTWKQMAVSGGDWEEDSGWYDSRRDDWREQALNIWTGMVLTRDHEVPSMTPIGMPEYQEDNPITPGDEKRNYAYSMISAQIPDNASDFPGSSIRAQQMSYMAGLTLRVTGDATSGYDWDFYKYERADGSDPKSSPKITGHTLTEIKLDKSKLPADIVTIKPFVNNVSGLYDERQSVGYDIVELDIDKLRKTVNIQDSDFDPDAWNDTYRLKSYSNNSDPADNTNLDWNGIVYIEVPYQSTATTRPDFVRTAKSNVAVKLVNGSVLPVPLTASDSSAPSNPEKNIPLAPDLGFTLATNAPLFTKGDYNADGISQSNGENEPDDKHPEFPAALYADAVTILSEQWSDVDSHNTSTMGTAKYTEVAAAIVAGIVPTQGGTASGGAHNFVRFLEKWQAELTIRGSLVSLYESEVATVGMLSNFSDWYGAPVRKWGYHDFFKDGYYPPGTPVSRDYKRAGMRRLTSTEYNAVVP